MSCILVVDDEQLIRFMAEEMLQRLGYEVVSASDAQEAIAMLSSEPVSRCNAMLSDISMPGQNGIELSKMVKIMRPNVKIFFMSGGDYSESEISEILEHGIDYMSKPFRMERLGEMLSSNNINP